MRVLEPGQPGPAADRLGVRAGQAQQGADDGGPARQRPARRDPREGPRAGPACEPEEDLLRLVVGGVGGEDDGGAPLPRVPGGGGEGLPAGTPGVGLGAVAGAGHLDPRDGDRGQTEDAGDVGGGRRHRVAARLQPVVHHGRADRAEPRTVPGAHEDGAGHGEREGVGAAGEGDEAAGTTPRPARHDIRATGPVARQGLPHRRDGPVQGLGPAGARRPCADRGQAAGPARRRRPRVPRLRPGHGCAPPTSRGRGARPRSAAARGRPRPR